MFRKYARGDLINHHKGGLYEITGTPADNLKVESSGNYAYAYRSCQEDETIWVRDACEVEDPTKFALVGPGLPLPFQDADLAEQKIAHDKAVKELSTGNFTADRPVDWDALVAPGNGFGDRPTE